MPQHHVLITTDYLSPGDGIHQRLTKAGLEVSYSRRSERGPGRDPELSSAIPQADAVIAGTDTFSSEIIGSARKLRIIARTGAGYDNVDLAAAAQQNITVCNTPGANRQSVAELTMALMLNCARRIVPAIQAVRKGTWTQSSGRELAGATLGILGLGAVGTAVASIANALGMRVLAHDPAIDSETMVAAGVAPRELFRLLAESDFVSMHLALTPQTRGLIDRNALQQMKPTAYLINTSRGGIVDEAALADALLDGRLSGAALDVLEREPLAADHPLQKATNLLITPHIAGATAEARSRSSSTAATDVINFLAGRPVRHPVVSLDTESDVDGK